MYVVREISANPTALEMCVSALSIPLSERKCVSEHSQH